MLQRMDKEGQSIPYSLLLELAVIEESGNWEDI